MFECGVCVSLEAWAHMELSMLLKQISLLSWVYLSLSISEEKWFLIGWSLWHQNLQLKFVWNGHRGFLCKICQPQNPGRGFPEVVKVLASNSVISACVISAWAHTELAMLLKRVNIPSFDCYLAFLGLVLVSYPAPRFWCLVIIRVQSMGPYGALHASETIQELLCLWSTSSCVSLRWSLGAAIFKVCSKLSCLIFI